MSAQVGRRIIRSSVGVTAATVAASLMSVLSQVVIARYFGVSTSLDAYLAAGALPLTFTGVLTGGVGYVLIPLLAELEARGGNVVETIDDTFLVAAVGALVIVVAGFFLSGYIVHWSAPRFSPEKLALAAHLQKYFWAATGATVLTSLAICLYHYRKHFAVPSVMTILPPLGMIGLTILMNSRMGIDSLATGYLVGTVLQCAILLIFLPERLRFKFAALSATTKRFLRGLIPLTLSLFPFTFLPVVDAFWSSRLPEGSLSYLGYSSRIVIGLTSVTIQGLTVVIFPFLSQNVAEGNLAVFRGRLLAALKMIFALMVFLGCLIWALRIPALTLLFERGRFGPQETLGLARVLGWYLVGMIGMACMNLINRGFYSTLRFKAPAIIGIGFLAVYFALSGWLSGHFSYEGVGMAYAVYWLAFASFACVKLGRDIGGLLQLHDFGFLGKALLLGVVTGLIVHVVWLYLRGGLGLWMQLLVSGGVGGAVLPMLAWLIFDDEEKRLFAKIVAGTVG